ncbi:unnamed protein product [Acanthoscelides obtectus]|uniref:ATP synthase F0 subunit 8 n=1 Tax=Acanthoscelides obtectus TaxID=200917 RepID=A0A9P0LN66_ACAOB|nr:unnamed protein product [Acanthoscelides obtectus]CAK1651324.1 hypothetical protein AOBTE_LOCUS17185 [Acanthoscelides obtectus]
MLMFVYVLFFQYNIIWSVCYSTSKSRETFCKYLVYI